MTEPNRVLCVSNDATRRERVATALEDGDSRLTVLTAAGFEAAVEYVAEGASDAVDVVVTDDETVASAPAILRAIREHHPDLPLVVLSEFTADGRRATAISEVVGFDGPLDDADAGGDVVAHVTGLLDDLAATGGTTDDPGADQPGDRSGAGPDEDDDNAARDDIVMPVKRELVDASSPIDIERAVCDRLTRDGRFVFAWIGEYDEGERQVVPWVTGSAVEGWPVSETFPVDSDGPETLVERVLRSRETAVVQDAAERPGTVPWADAAAEHGCSACILAPLMAGDERYGVLGAYSRTPIGDGERAAVAEIAGSVSNVLHSMALEGRIEQQERTLHRYERLVETVGDGMYALDEDGHFMTVNNGLVGMTAYSREGLLGEHVSIVMDEDDVEAGRDRIRELLCEDGPDATAMEMDVHTKDGRTIPCENQIALLVDDDGRFNGTVGVLRDITERKRRERELRRQNERLEAFAEIVSHDLRNPLSVAQGYVDLALESGSTDRLDNVDEALSRMEDIIGDVLALARHGQTVTEPEAVDLTEAVETAWGNVSTEAASLSLGELGVVAADRSRLLRLLENLFRNAVEHGGSDVTVTVAPLAAGDDLGGGFYVADDGRGMPDHVREHAFDSEFTTSEEGLGIGLWVVREVAHAHGWTVTATESEGGGARFEFADVDREA
ncbi:sensor histidine kinase [Halostella litorea]|uniref:sensor histidine kinase n=1 Tax=Halostella litorea TaxID=2528831 RepID=UPI001091F315|nr:PAS domain S-box protein [Halostella litorea]